MVFVYPFSLCLQKHIISIYIHIKHNLTILGRCSPYFQLLVSVSMFYPVCSVHTCVNLLSRILTAAVK